MFIFKKYKTLVYLNVENTAIGNSNNFKNPVYINYLQNKSLKVIRNFLFIYSIFLQVLSFDPFIYKSELEFKLRQNPLYFLMLDDDYNNFFI